MTEKPVVLASCARCLFFKPDRHLQQHESFDGYCFRHPPVIMQVREGLVRSHRPWVHRSDFCGEYRADAA